MIGKTQISIYECSISIYKCFERKATKKTIKAQHTMSSFGKEEGMSRNSVIAIAERRAYRNDSKYDFYRDWWATLFNGGMKSKFFKEFPELARGDGKFNAEILFASFFCDAGWSALKEAHRKIEAEHKKKAITIDSDDEDAMERLMKKFEKKLKAKKALRATPESDSEEEKEKPKKSKKVKEQVPPISSESEEEEEEPQEEKTKKSKKSKKDPTPSSSDVSEKQQNSPDTKPTQGTLQDFQQEVQSKKPKK